MNQISKKNLSYICAGIFLVIFSIIMSSTAVFAQPSCEWDCMTTDCCAPGHEFMCNGGTYGAFCPTACIGAGAWEAPIGMCL